MIKALFVSIFLFTYLWGDSGLDEATRLYEGNKFTKAYEIFERLCEKGSAKSCFSIAYMNENAQGVPKNDKLAYKFYDKSCSLGLAKACSNLALKLKDNGYEGEALLAFNRACKLYDTQSCNTLALYYEKEKDGVMAIEFYRSSCKFEDAGACYKLGSLYERGELVRQNLNSALSFYSKSCSLGLGEACYLLGRYYEKEKKEFSKAKRYFGMACDKRHKEACAVYRELNSKDIKLY